MVYQKVRQCQLILPVCIFSEIVGVDTVFGEVCEWAFSAGNRVMEFSRKSRSWQYWHFCIA